MKIQDIIFLVIFLVLILRRSPTLLISSGIICLILSIPLFYMWVFFTAQHLVFYAAALFLAAIVFLLSSKSR